MFVGGVLGPLIPNPQTEQVPLWTNPAGAEVLVDGRGGFGAFHGLQWKIQKKQIHDLGVTGVTGVAGVTRFQET